MASSLLDYCNSALACLSSYTVAPLQRVQNAAARLLLNRRKYDHITDGLRDLQSTLIAYHLQNTIQTVYVNAFNKVSARRLVKFQETATTEKFTFFWQGRDILSQWYISNFTVNGVTYNCAEQYMMHQKALHFKDEKLATQIMAAKRPVHQKKLGRQVAGYDENEWCKVCRNIVKDGNMAKFSQNRVLGEHLLNTAGTTLAEASPYDFLWGIGLKAEDPRACDRREWRGDNLLGKILMDVREDLLQQNGGYKEFLGVDSSDDDDENEADEGYTLFWRMQSPFSQWFPARFTLHSVDYNCAEQYMMHQKALFFKDLSCADAILEESDPRQQKRLAKDVHNFDESAWNEVSKGFVKEATTAKYSQNPDLRRELFATGNSVMVEASADDFRWGIGSTKDNRMSWRRRKWRGENWLGYIITKVRNELIKQHWVDRNQTSRIHRGRDGFSYRAFQLPKSPFHLFYPARVEIDGQEFASAGDFLHSKLTGIPAEDGASSCSDMKQVMAAIKEWTENDEIWLQRCNQAKFKQHEDLMDKLLDTAEDELVFAGKQQHLGVVDYKLEIRGCAHSENRLGKVLMRIRDEVLQASHSTPFKLPESRVSRRNEDYWGGTITPRSSEGEAHSKRSERGDWRGSQHYKDEDDRHDQQNVSRHNDKAEWVPLRPSSSRDSRPNDSRRNRLQDQRFSSHSRNRRSQSGEPRSSDRSRGDSKSLKEMDTHSDEVVDRSDHSSSWPRERGSRSRGNQQKDENMSYTRNSHSRSAGAGFMKLGRTDEEPVEMMDSTSGDVVDSDYRGNRFPKPQNESPVDFPARQQSSRKVVDSRHSSENLDYVCGMSTPRRSEVRTPTASSEPRKRTQREDSEDRDEKQSNDNRERSGHRSASGRDSRHRFNDERFSSNLSKSFDVMENNSHEVKCSDRRSLSSNKISSSRTRRNDEQIPHTASSRSHNDELRSENRDLSDERSVEMQESPSSGVADSDSPRQPGVVTFSGIADPLHLWYPAEITIDGQRYHCAGQALLHKAALEVFANTELAASILIKKCSEKDYKKLNESSHGEERRAFKHFVQDNLIKLNEKKFEQNVELCEILLATRDAKIAFASDDQFLGAGELGKDFKTAKNRLGKALVAVRKTFQRVQ